MDLTVMRFAIRPRRLGSRLLRVVLLTSSVVLGAAQCQSGTSIEPPSAAGPVAHRVLFIGNSLTYVNDLPATLVAVAATGGVSIAVSSVALPNYALIDHIDPPTARDALERISSAPWNFVVLQQGPTSQSISRDTLIIATRRFDPAIRAAGARPALYMVWPAARDTANFDRIRDSFRLAACSVSGEFWPAGEAWRDAWRADPTIRLYGSDGFHPAPLGTYLVALVMYERITGRDARSLPAQATANGVTLSAPASVVRVLQAAAHSANTRYAQACES